MNFNTIVVLEITREGIFIKINMRYMNNASRNLLVYPRSPQVQVKPPSLVPQLIKILCKYLMADEISRLKGWCIAIDTCRRLMPSTTANVSGFKVIIDR